MKRQVEGKANPRGKELVQMMNDIGITIVTGLLGKAEATFVEYEGKKNKTKKKARTVTDYIMVSDSLFESMSNYKTWGKPHLRGIKCDHLPVTVDMNWEAKNEKGNKWKKRNKEEKGGPKWKRVGDWDLFKQDLEPPRKRLKIQLTRQK